LLWKIASVTTELSDLAAERRAIPDPCVPGDAQNLDDDNDEPVAASSISRNSRLSWWLTDDLG
jgi:hypothetical protein